MRTQQEAAVGERRVVRVPGLSRTGTVTVPEVTVQVSGGRPMSSVGLGPPMNGSGSLAELLSLLLRALAAGILTAVGALTETAGIGDLLAGPSVFGLWEVAMGALLLYVGIYMLGYRQVWLGLRAAAAR